MGSNLSPFSNYIRGKYMHYKCPLCKEIDQETIIHKMKPGIVQKNCTHKYDDIAMMLAIQNKALKARLAMEREFSQELMDELETVLDPSDYAMGV